MDDKMVIAFYHTLGFAVATEVRGWATHAGAPTDASFLIMVDAGPLTWAAIRDRA